MDEFESTFEWVSLIEFPFPLKTKTGMINYMKLYWFIIMCVHYVAVTIISFQTISHVQISWISPLLTIHVNILFLFCSSSKFVILDETTQVNETISLLLFCKLLKSSWIHILFVGPVFVLFCFVFQFIYLLFLSGMF